MGLLHGLLAVMLLTQQPAQEPERQAPVDEPLAVEGQGITVAEARRIDYIYPLPGVPIVNDGKLERLMDAVDKLVYRAPVNASLDAGLRVIPERNGSALDRRRFAERFYGYIFEGDPTRLEAPLRTLYPKVDSELMASIKGKVVGQYYTFYNASNKNRSHNMSLAAKAINNYVVFPGETFSFNRVVGIRTAAKGYKRAPVIVRGELSEGIGGGICQISSTLFNAADRAGLRIVQRYSHSKHVPYVPSGRDATVSWGGPDFTFRNDYNQPIVIRASAQGGQVGIVIRSSELINDKPRPVPSASKKLPTEIEDSELHAGNDHRQ